MDGWLIFVLAVVATAILVRGIEKAADWVARGWDVEDEEDLYRQLKPANNEVMAQFAWWAHDCPEEGPDYMTACGEKCSYCGAEEATHAS